MTSRRTSACKSTHTIQAIPHGLTLPPVYIDSRMISASHTSGCNLQGAIIWPLETLATKKVPKTAVLMHVRFGAVFEAHERGLATMSDWLLPIKGTLGKPRSTAMALEGVLDLICGHNGVLSPSNFQLSEVTGGPMREGFGTCGSWKLEWMSKRLHMTETSSPRGRASACRQTWPFWPINAALRQILLSATHMHSGLPVGEGP